MTGAPEGSSAIDPRIDAVARVLYDRERASATLWSGLNDEEKEGWRATASAFLAAADAVAGAIHRVAGAKRVSEPDDDC